MGELRQQFPESVRGANLFALDHTLAAYLAAESRPALERHRESLSRFGAFVGGLADEEAAYTDRYAPPLLEPYDGAGRLINRIRLNPLAARANQEVYALGAVGLNYTAEPAPYLITFAMGYLLSQSNLSLHCPVTMTGAVAHVLHRFSPEALRARYLRQLTRMDGAALTGGTWATERQGGSDIGATTTRAVADGEGEARLYGLKWFASNPAGGLALATARPDGGAPGTAGLGLYLVPFADEDGTPNAIRIRRLKEKLGSRGVPTGELDLDGALSTVVAPPPSGFRLMMEALTFSRIHNALSAVGTMRRALLEAVGYALRREAFCQPIFNYPMVQQEILHILLAYKAGFALAFEAASAFDRIQAWDEADAPDRVWLRLVTALAKFATGEDAIASARRALEIIGGNGYTSDYVTERLLRDAQVLTVWEGPANIQALELLRLLWGRANGAALYRARIADLLAQRAEPALAEGLASFDEAVAFLGQDETARPHHARRLAGLMADLLAAALLLTRTGPAQGGLLQRFIAERLAPPPHRGIVPGDALSAGQLEALLETV